jgi:hypothetical protein
MIRSHRHQESLFIGADYLYGFKAARRAARAANSARSPLLPLALPQRRRKTPVGRREEQKIPGRFDVQESPGSAAGVWFPCSRSRYSPGRPEPVKSAYGVGCADLRLLMR